MDLNDEFLIALKNEDISVINALKEKGFDFNNEFWLNYNNNKILVTPIYCYILYDKYNLLKYTLTNICSISDHKRKYLHDATLNDDYDAELIQLLLDNNVDINEQGQRNITAFMNACIDDNLEIAQFLYTHGADINMKSTQGFNALYYACANVKDSIDLIIWLLEIGINIDGENELLKDMNQNVKIKCASSLQLYFNDRIDRAGLIKSLCDINVLSNPYNEKHQIILSDFLKTKRILDNYIDDLENHNLYVAENPYTFGEDDLREFKFYLYKNEFTTISHNCYKYLSTDIGIITAYSMFQLILNIAGLHKEANYMEYVSKLIQSTRQN